MKIFSLIASSGIAILVIHLIAIVIANGGEVTYNLLYWVAMVTAVAIALAAVTDGSNKQ